MDSNYPINLNLTGKSVVIIGGGKIAERKIKALLDTGAHIKVVSPEMTIKLKNLAEANLITWAKKHFSSEDIEGAKLVIAATDSKQINLKVKNSASHETLVSLVDNPEHSDFQLPSVLRRGKLSLAISTSGASPMLAKKIKGQLEDLFDEKYEDYLEFLAQCRQIIIEKVQDPVKKKQLLTEIIAIRFLENADRDREFEALLKGNLEK